MSVMYSVACLLELDEGRGQTIFSDGEREMYGGWIDEWAEWVMNDLPSESLDPQQGKPSDRKGLSVVDFSIVSISPFSMMRN